MAQSIRRSQFITIYGPGAILEGPDGPRVIPTLHNLSQTFSDRGYTWFEIPDQRLSQALLDGAGILRLPSNAELGMEESRWIYDTLAFPSWSLCVKHSLLYRKSPNSGNRACPQCPPQSSEAEAWRQARRQAIRFVRACPRGHLDDVDWVGTISHTRDDCNPSYLFWRGGGGALRDINIECPNCNARINLGIAYAREWQCSGRYPERGSSRPGCSAGSRIVQRGAANLRMSELLTALSIPPRTSRLHRILEISVIRTAILTAQGMGINISSKQQLLNVVQSLISGGLLRQSVRIELEIYDEQTVLNALSDVSTTDQIATVSNWRLQELAALRSAATNGHPPQPSATPGAPDEFEVQRNQVRLLPGTLGQRLRITPVNRLRVVMVQTGYRRLDPLNPVVDCKYEDDQQRCWYPGVELFGEGIFIDLVPEAENSTHQPHFQLAGREANTWRDAWITPEAFSHTVNTPEERDLLHPVFVWWHTLAHRLLNALAIDSGYSSAALRERVYVEVDEETGEASGGILLYTAQPGGDGTLGGLVALVPEFERVLHTAFRDIDACSNDPLCSGEAFASEKYNGAACYACALVSETSCEFRNMRLDRNLLKENLPSYV